MTAPQHSQTQAIHVDELGGGVLLARFTRELGLFGRDDAPELVALVERADRDPKIRAVVFTGSHPGRFISHADLAWLQEDGSVIPPVNRRLTSSAARVARQLNRNKVTRWMARKTPMTGALQLDSMHSALSLMTTSSTIFVAALNGSALGVGAEISWACDLRLMAEGDYFIGHPEVLLGFAPGAGGTQRLPRLIGSHRALVAILEGTPFSGLGATREMGLAPYAERFVAAGLVVLVFTYRHLGDSGGEPRQVLSMARQLADWDAALAYAAELPEVDRDRMAVWGSSLGGGHAIRVAARHPELRAAVAQCPFTDGLASAASLGIRESLVLSRFVARDLVAAARGKQPVTVPVAARTGQLGLMTAPDALPGMHALLPDDHHWVNQAAARSVTSLIRYRPGRSAKHVAAPILICISATDSVAPPAQSERYARQAPRGDVRLYDAGHFAFYVGEAFEQLVADQTEFLVSHLQAEPAPPGPLPTARAR